MLCRSNAEYKPRVQAYSTPDSRPWQSTISAIQLAFGKPTTDASPYTNDYMLKLSEDLEGWHGASDLFICFHTPSWVLLLEPHTATVAFGVQTTPVTAHTFVRRLGPDLAIFKAALGDTEHVYLSIDLPNQSGTIIGPVLPGLMLHLSTRTTR